MRIGIFGGTFNPPHIGHIQGAQAAVEQLALDKLLVVPAGIPPHKSLPENSPDANMRLEMTTLAFESIAVAEISDLEIFSDEPIYTAQTVATLKKLHPGETFVLLVGTDMYLTLETWKDSETLLSSVTPAVFSRGLGDMEKIISHSKMLKERYGADTEIIDNDVVVISSSELRELLGKGQGIGYITDTNYSYIIAGRLYGARPNWEWLRQRSYEMHDSERIAHVKGCEAEAVSLAKRWGVDMDDAREAAILHDITKRLSLEENVQIFQDHGIVPDERELSEEKLLHAKTGAHLAKTLFGISEAVFDAIFWHTTGRIGMSELEKIIFLADFIEPERDFPGVDEMRALSYENVDAAMILGLETSLKDLYDRGIVPNPLSIDALQYLRSSNK